MFLTDEQRREYNRKRSKAYYETDPERWKAYYRAYHKAKKASKPCSPPSEPASHAVSSRFLELLEREKKLSCQPSTTA